MIKIASNLQRMLEKQSEGSMVFQMPAPAASPNARDIVGGDYADKHLPYFPSKREKYLQSLRGRPQEDVYKQFGGPFPYGSPESNQALDASGLGGFSDRDHYYSPISLTPEAFNRMRSSNLFSRMGLNSVNQKGLISPNISAMGPFSGRNYAAALNTMVGLQGYSPEQLDTNPGGVPGGVNPAVNPGAEQLDPALNLNRKGIQPNPVPAAKK